MSLDFKEMVDVYEDDLRVVETIYQACIISEELKDIFTGDVLKRYEDDALIIINKVSRVFKLNQELKEELVNYIVGNYSDKLCNLVKSRVPKNYEELIYLLWKYMAYERDENNIKAMIKLTELNGNIEELIRYGVLMHIDYDYVVIPRYLANYLSNLSTDIEIPKIYDVLNHVIDDYTLTSILEILIFKLKPSIRFYKLLYGIDYREFIKKVHIPKLVTYVEETRSVVFNPLIDPIDLRSAYHDVKNARSRSILRKLEIHGSYDYVKSIKCGVVYTLFSDAERGLVLLCPWIVPTRRFIQYFSNTPRIIITTISPSIEVINSYSTELVSIYPELRRTVFTFLQEETAYVLKPKRVERHVENLIHILYASGFEVVEF